MSQYFKEVSSHILNAIICTTNFMQIIVSQKKNRQLFICVTLDYCLVNSNWRWWLGKANIREYDIFQKHAEQFATLVVYWSMALRLIGRQEMQLIFQVSLDTVHCVITKLNIYIYIYIYIYIIHITNTTTQKRLCQKDEFDQRENVTKLTKLSILSPYFDGCLH